MATDQLFVLATATIILALIAGALLRKRLDPFAPVWLFLAGYFQLYVVQATSYREYALRVRGLDLVTSANLRALWALGWFLLVYFSGLGPALARRLPRAPEGWSAGLVGGMAPPLIAWGLVCSGVMMAQQSDDISAEENLLRQFPAFLLVAGVILLVTGRSADRPRPLFTAMGLAVTTGYSLIWMFNGKRSHALFGVLAGVCAFYVPKGRRPNLAVMAITGVACALVVAVALNWRNNNRYERSVSGFLKYVSEFNVESVLVSLNVREAASVDPQAREQTSKETEEYCAYLLMLDTVPAKSEYDYGESYVRIVSTFIPRVIWKDKPFFGRRQWVGAWIAGSEFHRDERFTGPAVGILGAAQLNGGAVATVVVLGVLATMIRTAYEYFRVYSHTTWAQAWWSLTYFNAWLMTANDDPFVWFYYIYGFAILPPMAFLWLANRLGAPRVGTVPLS
ncbi:MAG TPA: hypothetical protein VG406_16100 [Isosphaeraceae bacterium]|jgi:hypothetical protein|nr:hypothetical protein [Isosphaeraceae bacterium]